MIPANSVCADPLSTNTLYVLNIWYGKLATIPAKIMIETPFPIPLSDIWSPSQTVNIAPAASITIINM